MLSLTLFGAALVGLAATPAKAHAQLEGFLPRDYASSAYAYAPAVYRAYYYAYPAYYYTPGYTSSYYTPPISSYSYIPAYAGYYTYASPVAVRVISTEAPPVAVASNPLPAATRSMYYDPSNSANEPATIIVHVPENATLLVNGKRTRSTSSTRLFYSPPLESGKSYQYDFEARMDRDGQTLKARKRVEVGAGDRHEISITMPDLDQSSERQSPARLPAENRDLPARPTPPESK
jgi:uncharacterized protein (TIGR03000 family)